MRPLRQWCIRLHQAYWTPGWRAEDDISKAYVGVAGGDALVMPANERPVFASLMECESMIVLAGALRPSFLGYMFPERV